MGVAVAVRPFRAADARAVADLFVATVRSVNARDYDAAQVAAWSAGGTDPARWVRTFAGRAAFVAEVGDDVAGFADVTADGLFDHLFVSPDHQREGVGTALAEAVEAAARASGCAQVRAEASITARPFFLARGYRVVTAQDKPAHGLIYRNYWMVKDLPSGRGGDGCGA